MVTNRIYSEFNSGKKFMGGTPQQMLEIAKRKDKKLQLYADRFQYFFRPEFMIKRMFENLNAENKPNYIGYRKACEDIFDNQYVGERAK